MFLTISPSMDEDGTVHITFVEEQSPSNDMDSDLQDNARSSFISTNSSGTSGTSEADDFNYRDSVISCSSLDSTDGGTSMNDGMYGAKYYHQKSIISHFICYLYWQFPLIFVLIRSLVISFYFNST